MPFAGREVPHMILLTTLHLLDVASDVYDSLCIVQNFEPEDYRSRVQGEGEEVREDGYTPNPVMENSLSSKSR